MKIRNSALALSWMVLALGMTGSANVRAETALQDIECYEITQDLKPRLVRGGLKVEVDTLAKVRAPAGVDEAFRVHVVVSRRGRADERVILKEFATTAYATRLTYELASRAERTTFWTYPDRPDQSGIRIVSADGKTREWRLRCAKR